MISTFTAIFDANVLYKMRLTSLLLFLAEQKMFRARWTDDIHEEWCRNLAANNPSLPLDKIAARRAAMDRAVPDARVEGYQSITVEGLPDPDDNHVVAAAILTRASMIVTFNMKDFPAEILKPLRLEARHPDDFLLDQYTLAPDVFVEAAQLDRAHYQKPPLSVDQYLSALEKSGTPETAARLREVAILLE